MASIEEQALELLRATQSSDQATRKSAEQNLDQLKSKDDFAAALVTIGSHQELPVNDRLSALINLKKTITLAWSAGQEDYEGGELVSDEARNSIRARLLSIVFASNVDSKITSAAANAIAKIARCDFPEEWPDLLETVLGQLSQSNDDQAHAILVVLDELLSDGLEEGSFYAYANTIVAALHQVATNDNRKLMVRAEAIKVFRQFFDFVENLKDKEHDEIKTFTQTVCDAWSPFLLQVVQSPLPSHPSDKEEDEGTSEAAQHWRGGVALKIQVLLTLARIQLIFPDLMPTQQFFEASWRSIQDNGPAYYESYVNGERQGSLVDGVYQLQYTLDFLVIEEIDYVQTLLEAPLVQEHLNSLKKNDVASGGEAVPAWISQVLQTLITFSAITKEAASMWEFDYNVFLSEETFAETNNSPRSVCAGFVWKISSWFPQETLEGLLNYIKVIFGDTNSTWRSKEAALFTLQQVAEEFSHGIRGADINAVRPCVEAVHPALNDDHEYLRARAHITMAAVLGAWSETLKDHDLAMNYANLSLNALEGDKEDIVKAACIRIMREYLTILPAPQATQLQPRIVNCISDFLQTQDFTDMDEYADLIDVVLQTVRDTIMANPNSCLDHNALDVLLTMVKYGAARDQNSAVLIDEAFESACEAMAKLGGDYYERLCRKVLPSLMAALDVEEKAELTALTDVSISVLRILVESAREPLPHGFIGAAMPRICRLIFSDSDFYQRQTATSCIRHMLINDKDQVFTWVDPMSHRNGLAMCFHVIGHLLGPSVDDASAAEVGELAVTMIEKAGSSVLGASLNELLQIVASRLATAEHHGLIQSLSMVFARLSLMSAPEIVGFLAGCDINGQPALAIVLRKWLESASYFAGFDTLRQNAHALVAIYRLGDPRVDAVIVQGDLIPDQSSRIKTRSMSRKVPIQYTSVTATEKMIKLLANELTPYGDPNNAFIPTPLKSPGLGAPRRKDSEDSWESEEGSISAMFGKSSDHETQEFLVEFFKAEGADPKFQEIFSKLTDEEQKRCHESVKQWEMASTQRAQLGA